VKLSQELHALALSVLQLHKDEIQACLEPSIAPHFVQGGKVIVVTKNLLFLRGQPQRKLRDRYLGPFYGRGAYWETPLLIKTDDESSLTSGVSRQQFHVNKAMLYNLSSTCRPNHCSIR
jgi:hypothetical protein